MIVILYAILFGLFFFIMTLIFAEEEKPSKKESSGYKFDEPDIDYKGYMEGLQKAMQWIRDQTKKLVDEHDGILHVQNFDVPIGCLIEDAYAIVSISDRIGNISYFLYSEADEEKRKLFDEEMAKSKGIEPDFPFDEHFKELSQVDTDYLYEIITEYADEGNY